MTLIKRLRNQTTSELMPMQNPETLDEWDELVTITIDVRNIDIESEYLDAGLWEHHAIGLASVEDRGVYQVSKRFVSYGNRPPTRQYIVNDSGEWSMNKWVGYEDEVREFARVR